LKFESDESAQSFPGVFRKTHWGEQLLAIASVYCWSDRGLLEMDASSPVHT
jgi:hypothetical protein